MERAAARSSRQLMFRKLFDPLHTRLGVLENQLAENRSTQSRDLKTLKNELQSVRDELACAAARTASESASLGDLLREMRAELQDLKQSHSSRTDDLLREVGALGQTLDGHGQAQSEARFTEQLKALEERLARAEKERDELRARREPTIPPLAQRGAWFDNIVRQLSAREERGDTLSAPVMRLRRAFEETRELELLAESSGDVALDEALFQRLDGALWGVGAALSWGELLGRWSDGDRQILGDAETMLWAYRAEVARLWRDIRALEPMEVVPGKNRFDVTRHESSPHLLVPCADPALDDVVAGVERPGYIVNENGAPRTIRRALVRRYALQSNLPPRLPTTLAFAAQPLAPAPVVADSRPLPPVAAPAQPLVTPSVALSSVPVEAVIESSVAVPVEDVEAFAAFAALPSSPPGVSRDESHVFDGKKFKSEFWNSGAAGEEAGENHFRRLPRPESGDGE